MRLSQGQLNLLTACPRKFQQVVLDQLGAIAPDQQIRLDWGSRFHLLMQQRELGLPIERLSRADEQMHQWVQAFLQTASELLTPQPNQVRQSEHRRTLEFEGYLLTTVYDLLVLYPDAAEIFDWKTYPRPQHRQGLAQDWQTRLYPFVLVETSDYKPEQVSMSYWFIQAREPDGAQPRPQTLRFAYSQAQHDQTRQDLSHLLSHLTTWLERYETTAEPFPQLELGNALCGRCPFDVRCQRQTSAPASPDPQPVTIAEIQEIVL